MFLFVSFDFSLAHCTVLVFSMLGLSKSKKLILNFFCLKLIVCKQKWLVIRKKLISWLWNVSNQEALKTWRYRLLKNLKTPFLSRYSKFLLIGNWYWYKHSPKFFSKKKFQQLRSLELSKIWTETGRWGRLIQQRQNFFHQISANMWWTNGENFRKISQTTFE